MRPWPLPRPRWLLASLGLLAAPALAHNGLPETSHVTVRPGHPEDLFVGATFGALVSRNGGLSWGWICPESLGYESWFPESYLWLPSGELLAATGQHLLRSEDHGCSWQPHPFFSSLRPRALASTPSQPSRLYVATARPGASNTLYRSDDAGRSFSPTALQRADTLLTSVRVAPSNPLRLYVTASAPQGLLLFRSDDGGLSWLTLPQPLPQLERPYSLALLRVDETDPDRLWARVSSLGRTWVLLSTNGGETLKPTLTVDDTLLDMEASADGRTLWLATFNHLYRSVDGSPPQPLPLPEGNSCAHRSGNTLYACGSSWVHDWWLARSSDSGDTWEPLLTLERMQGVLDCPAGSPTRELCGPRWPQLLQLLEAPTDGGMPPPPPDAGTSPDAGEPPAPPPPPKGCSATGGGLGAVAWVLMLSTLRRVWRRRQETHG